jgi:hypothetical protein
MKRSTCASGSGYVPSCSIGFFVADRDLALLHRLEERGLHLRRRAVDLVREQQVREHRTLLRRELARLRRVDERADDVGRQQVGRERYALEAEPERLRERVDRERLREARHALEQYVPASDEREYETVDELLLPDDHLCHLVADARHELRLRGYPVGCFLQVHDV